MIVDLLLLGTLTCVIEGNSGAGVTWSFSVNVASLLTRCFTEILTLITFKFSMLSSESLSKSTQSSTSLSKYLISVPVPLISNFVFKISLIFGTVISVG